MSGHSKWATIKRKKGAADAKRGQVFTKYANAIAVAAREGSDMDTNYKLRLAVDKAKTVNMPTSNIQRAIDRGSGKSQEKLPEDVRYEGYGPGGVALLVSCATDNTNRTLAEVKSTITKSGGRLAEPGAVAYQFQQKGLIVVSTDRPDEASLIAIDAGAEDIENEGDSLSVYTPPKQLMAVKQALENGGYAVDSAELSYEPTQTMEVTTREVAAKIIRLVEDLEGLDDVVAVYSNFDIPEDILGELAE